MPTLTGTKLKDTYKDLLQVSNSNAGVDATIRIVEDGEGTSSAFWLSTTDARVYAASAASKFTVRAGSAQSSTNLQEWQSSGGTVLGSIDPSGYATFPRVYSTSQRMVIASQAGITMDTNLTSGGGTDATAALQAILDTATAASPLYFVIDGPARITAALRLKSYTTLHFINGGGLFVTSSSNCCAITNYNRSLSTRTDTRITILGGYINCNGANQADTEADGTICCGITFLSGTEITVDGTHVYDPHMWGCVFSNVDDWRLENYRMERHSTTPRISQDGFNIRGPSKRGFARNLRIKSYDDAFALNSRLYDNVEATSLLGPYIGGGDITDVLIDGVYLEGCLLGPAIYSDFYLVDRITIRNVFGSVMYYALSLSYDPLNSSNNGTGNIGSILFENCQVENITSTLDLSVYGFASGLVRVNATAKHLSVRNVRCITPFDTRPLVDVATLAGVVGVLEINGLNVHDASGTGEDLVSIHGTVNSLSIGGVRWFRGDGASQAGSVLNVDSTAGVVGGIVVSDVTQRRGRSCVRQTAGPLTAVNIDGLRQETCAGAALENVSGAPTFRLSNFNGAATVSGSASGSLSNTQGDGLAHLLRVARPINGVDSTLRQVEDNEGTDTYLQVATDKIGVGTGTTNLVLTPSSMAPGVGVGNYTLDFGIARSLIVEASSINLSYGPTVYGEQYYIHQSGLYLGTPEYPIYFVDDGLHPSLAPKWAKLDANTSGSLVTSVYNGASAVEAFRVQYSSSASRASIGGPVSSTARFIVYSAATSNIPLAVAAAASQTADIQRWQDSAGNMLAAITHDGALRFAPTTPSTITSDQDSYNPGTGTIFRLSSDASRNITGLFLFQTDGRIVILVNIGSYPIVLKHNNSSSTAVNRMLCSTGGDITLMPGELALGYWDDTDDRWRITSLSHKYLYGAI